MNLLRIPGIEDLFSKGPTQAHCLTKTTFWISFWGTEFNLTEHYKIDISTSWLIFLVHIAALFTLKEMAIINHVFKGWDCEQMEYWMLQSDSAKHQITSLVILFLQFLIFRNKLSHFVVKGPRNQGIFRLSWIWFCCSLVGFLGLLLLYWFRNIHWVWNFNRWFWG
jgi:hypothetical protein